MTKAAVTLTAPRARTQARAGARDPNPTAEADVAGLGRLGDRDALEALAQRVADLVADRIAVGPPLVDADALARYLGVERSWCYEHAAELGAIRLGDGPRARLRFNVAEVERRLTCPGSRGSEEAANRVAARNRTRRRSRPLGTSAPLATDAGTGWFFGMYMLRQESHSSWRSRAERRR